MLYNSKGTLCGLMGIHVDDLLVSGAGPEFEQAMKKLEGRLPFGSRKYEAFTYCGIPVTQMKNGAITLDQNQYIEDLQPMTHKHLANDKKIPESESTNYKALCGGLSWAAINTRPDCGFDVSWLASKGPTATGQDVAFGNKIMRRTKTTEVL